MIDRFDAVAGRFQRPGVAQVADRHLHADLPEPVSAVLALRPHERAHLIPGPDEMVGQAAPGETGRTGDKHPHPAGALPPTSVD